MRHPSGILNDPVTLKLVAVGVLSLALLIPISLVRSVIDERIEWRNEAITDITSTWGGSQTLVGPVLLVPYRYRYRTSKDEVIDGKTVRREVVETAVDTAYFLPEELNIAGELHPSRLYRGIYEAVVYSGRLDLSGRFPALDWEGLKIDPADVIWDDAVLSIGISDLRGAKGALSVKLGGNDFVMLPGSKVPGYANGAHAQVGDAAKGTGAAFALAVDLNGSTHVRFAPLGVRNLVALKSAWPDPKFEGSSLPVEREVSHAGFSAKWDVSYYARNYPQFSTERGGGRPDASAVDASLFGVRFLTSVDSYRNVERATKYGILFIVITFLVFFLFEVLAALRIHPVQYAFVGLALCLFFLVLLSLSEFIDFRWSYLAAAAMSTAMIVLYGRKFLGGGRRAVVLGGELAAAFTYLYVVLQLQDLSLLMGSLLLVSALAGAMYLTRDVDWYALSPVGKQAE